MKLWAGTRLHIYEPKLKYICLITTGKYHLPVAWGEGKVLV